MLRFFDFILSLLGLVIASPVFIMICILGYFDNGSPIFLQIRMGRYKKPFTLIKFRTMSIDTPTIPSHLTSSSAITPLGKILRRTKLDELPQLLNVLKGEMSLVGPRPNLISQEDLIYARDRFGIYSVRPGITGLAQIRNIDMSMPIILAQMDFEMIKSLNLLHYFKYIIKTIMGSGAGDAVKL